MAEEIALQKTDGRFHELDSLRGIAALSVVFLHFRLMWTTSQTHKPRWLVLINPFTVGSEAVLFFFLLSGFVLALPLIRGKQQSYPIFLMRRIFRIYMPYLGAFGLALVGAAIWHKPLGTSEWADSTWSHPVTLRTVIEQMTLIGNYNWAQYNTAFWSLVMEMRISIIFPALYWVTRALGARGGLAAAVTCSGGAALAIWRWPSAEQTVITIQYASIFMWGILFAIHLEAINACYQKLTRGMKRVLAISSMLLFTWGHHIARMVNDENFSLDQTLIVFGAMGYMLLSLNSRRLSNILTGTIPRFLGRISYSLYLVHATVLFAIFHLLGHRLPMLE